MQQHPLHTAWLALQLSANSSTPKMVCKSKHPAPLQRPQNFHSQHVSKASEPLLQRNARKFFFCRVFNCEDNRRVSLPGISSGFVEQCTDDHPWRIEKYLCNHDQPWLAKSPLPCVYVSFGNDDTWLSSSLAHRGHDMDQELYSLIWLAFLAKHL